MKKIMRLTTGLSALLATGLAVSSASASLVVGIDSVVLSPDTGSFSGANQTIQDFQGSVEASAWYNGSGLEFALNDGDTVPGVLPLHQYGQNFVGFESARIRVGSAPFAAGTNLTFGLINETDGLNGLLLWNHTESNATESLRNARGIASATVSFSTDGTTFFGSESLTFAAGPTDNTNGEFVVSGQTLSFGSTYDNVNFVRFSNLANFNGALEVDQNLLGLAELRFTAVIPEPSSMVVLVGLAGIALLPRRRK